MLINLNFILNVNDNTSVFEDYGYDEWYVQTIYQRQKSF